MSLKTIPGLGKSGMSRMNAAQVHHLAIRRRSRTSSRCFRCEATAARFSSASSASLRRSGFRERSDGREDLLQQRRLALGGGLEHAQVAPGHAVARQLRAPRARSRARSRRSSACRRVSSPLMIPKSSSSCDEPRLGAGLLDDVVERVRRAARPHRHRHPPRRRAGAAAASGAAAVRARRRRGLLDRPPRRELLPDHGQRHVLVALQPQDRPQPRHVGRRIEPVAAGRPPRRHQLLVLEVPDLGDRDVRELLLEPLADRADRQRLRLPRRLFGRFACERRAGGGVVGHGHLNAPGR